MHGVGKRRSQFPGCSLEEKNLEQADFGNIRAALEPHLPAFAFHQLDWRGFLRKDLVTYRHLTYLSVKREEYPDIQTCKWLWRCDAISKTYGTKWMQRIWPCVAEETTAAQSKRV